MSKTPLENPVVSGPSRRAVLAATAAMLPLAARPGRLLLAAPVPAPDSMAFLRLSAFPTGKPDLDATLAARFLAALQHYDAGFGAGVAALQDVIGKTKAGSIDALLERPEADAGIRKTIGTIVSAWYLGIVGNETGAELITYAEALMYRPTQKELIIPTYGGGPDSWGPKPDDRGATL